MKSTNADTLVVLDFETTGLSPLQGDRAIEIGAVKIEQGKIHSRFQALMNPGRPVNAFIENYTGISNQMLRTAQSNEVVMKDFADFIEDHHLIAHNASFDQKFLDAELSLINRNYNGEFGCSLLLSRRLYQDAPNHKLGTLVRYKNIAADGNYHRALFDAEMTTQLWLAMLDDIQIKTGLSEVPFSLVKKLSKTPKAQIEKLLSEQ